MSTTIIEVVEIGEVRPHDNADRLEVATVGGATVVVGKGAFHAGDKAVYFPPNMLIPDNVAESLGVSKYLKHAEYTPGEGVSQCRVAGCRLRGQPSFGFLVEIPSALIELPAGSDVTVCYGGKKYEPPVKVTAADAAEEHNLFHRYTGIENYHKYPSLIPDGTPVRITEKIHGSNCRIGLVREGSELVFMAGSHKVRRKRPLDKPIDGKVCPYWEPLSKVELLLYHLMNWGVDSAIVFGEIYGPGVQDMDYSVQPGKRGFRVFDISVDGKYLDWHAVETKCCAFGVETAPLLYSGHFAPHLVAQYTYGDSVVGKSRKFTGREGIVITPLSEMVSARGQRVILKSISADYLDRKGAEDNE